MRWHTLILAASLVVVLDGVLVAPAGAADATDGFIYGTITTRTGNTYTGLMRWGDEEAFWDDLFHSSKEELPYIEFGEDEREAEDDEEGTLERWLQVFGQKVRVRLDGRTGSRIFIARFGDVARIEVVGSDDAELTMKDGTVVAVSGYANDVGGTVNIRDAAMGDIGVQWKRIDTIVFKPTPRDVRPEGYRLYGKVATDAGDFEGWVQWDKEESISTDKLDGDSEDGRLSIEMGQIRSIERRSRRSSKVELKDGRTLILDGTNDVDDDNRGICVEDPRYGRVVIPWSAFEKVEFSDPRGSGRGYGAYVERPALRGTVVDAKGGEHTGRLVFDLDETRAWEMLNGESFDVEYNIPFELVAAIEPRGRSSSTVTLRSGEQLRLEDSQDVSARNDGVLILQAEGNKAHTYVAWDDITRIAFE